MTRKEGKKDIIKSDQDQRMYRGIELGNGLKIMLISDPETEKSAAALEVNVGSLLDPPQVPGLAHFCEHMLFLGTEKYPIENDYAMYLASHGGMCNACTGDDYTRYFFDVIPDYLAGTLDRFAQFFIGPLFTESATSREINAVNSEHEKNIPSDNWRLFRLEQCLAKPGHDFRKFRTGNLKTLDETPNALGVDVRQELLNFHSNWYSANTMTLAVLGKDSLDELEAMVVPVFSQIANKNVKRPEWLHHPFGPDQAKKMAYMAPIEDTRMLNISFALPDFRKYYKSKPSNVISHLVGHEGPGSILSVLKERGWCNMLVCGCRTPARGFSFFNLSVDLTIEGLQHVDDIITLIFQYLNMIRQAGPLKAIYDECQQLNNITFRFKDKETPVDYVHTICKNLQRYPLEEGLFGSFIMSDYRQDLIDDVLGCLVPSNVCVAVISQIYESVGDIEEEFYGMKYKLTNIDESTIEKWEKCGTCSELFLPKPNIFIPTNFDLLPVDEATISKHPTIIYNSDLTRLWYKQDDVFRLPKANVKFEIFSPFAFLDPFNTSLTQMFTLLLKDELNESSYDASLASLKWNVSANKYGFDLEVRGYNNKLKVLFDIILDKITNFTVNDKRFEIYKENYIRDLKNFELKPPFKQSIQYMLYLLAQHSWMPSEFLEVAVKMTPRDLREMIPLLLSRIHIEGLIHGNYSKAEALTLVQEMEEKLGKNWPLFPLTPQQLLRGREINLGDDAHFLYETRNKVHKSSCTYAYFQCGQQNTQSTMELEFLNKIISEPFFDELRTKEQLGYIVFNNTKVGSGVVGLRVLVQSDKHPEYLLTRIEAFLVKMRGILTKITDEEFDEHREALIACLLEKPKKLTEQTKLFWAEISAQQYHFGRVEVEAAYLKTITREQLLKFFDTYISPDAPNRHRLTISIVSDAEGGAGHIPEPFDWEKETPENLAPAPSMSQVTRIRDVTRFKSSHALYPLPQPFIDFPGNTKSKL